MGYHEDDQGSLEQLLESLIKMVGKANKNVDSLQVRVRQLESLIREQQIVVKESDPLEIYPHHHHHSTDKFPLHL
ncbi:hypothetical protein L1999_28175 [Neobacillus drentensis]|uniref:hypothetical protein n=1 Tax=Neobacillus drentensis TaxID=220684 RepID=UPI001F26B7AF|nr:hypothetical protein [Neobacillus drentensis]ULT56838.1 hypothetical protein L1999_28175 [Neobacillus drentensis]